VVRHRRTHDGRSTTQSLIQIGNGTELTQLDVDEPVSGFQQVPLGSEYAEVIHRTFFSGELPESGGRRHSRFQSLQLLLLQVQALAQILDHGHGIDHLDCRLNDHPLACATFKLSCWN